MSNFKIGEKVVCVKPIDELIMGEYYTISYIGEFGNIKVLESSPCGDYIYFWDWRFRKLDHQFAEDVCAELIKEFNQEKVLN